MHNKSLAMTLASALIVLLVPKATMAQAIGFGTGPTWNDTNKTATFDISWVLRKSTTSATVVATLDRWDGSQWIFVSSLSPQISFPPNSGTIPN